MLMRYAVAIVASTIVTGCAALLAGGGGSSAPAVSTATSAVSALPSPSEFDYVGKSKTEIAFMDPAALLDGTPIEADVIQRQCAMKTPDPLFFIPSDKVANWTFAGRVNPDGTFQALDYKNILTFGLTGSEQVGTWPITLVPLSEFPTEYLEQRLQFVAADKIDAGQQKQLAATYIANSQKLEMIVAQLESSYDPKEGCVTRN
jgi:hypothetical protein